VGLGGGGLQQRSLQQQQQHEPLLPTAAVLMAEVRKEGGEEGEEEGEEGHVGRVAQVVMGETYRVSLHDFPPGRSLSLRLVPKMGPSTLLGFTTSSSSSASSSVSRGRQEWVWTVSKGKHPEGEYFIEVTSQAKDTFSYTQAFDLVE